MPKSALKAATKQVARTADKGRARTAINAVLKSATADKAIGRTADKARA